QARGWGEGRAGDSPGPKTLDRRGPPSNRRGSQHPRVRTPRLAIEHPRTLRGRWTIVPDRSPTNAPRPGPPPRRCARPGSAPAEEVAEKVGRPLGRPPLRPPREGLAAVVDPPEFHPVGHTKESC